MFGLDERIAALSDGTTLLFVIVVAVVVGLRHASDPDHLAAVTTLIASGRERAARSAARLGLVWGLTVVADSAQFSAAISELAPAGTAGSALSLQLAIGFLLTVVTILGVGALSPTDGIGWRVAFAALALGPMVGIVAMALLRLRPEAARMASGHR